MLLLVMGMGRTGTSLLMQVLHAAGFDCGSDFIPDNENNPRGYFERRSVMSFNIHLLQQATGDTQSLYPIPDEDSIERLVGTPIPIKFPTHDYAVKDPRFSFTFPIWYPYLQEFDLRIILSRRNEEAIVESMARAYAIDFSKGRDIVREYVSRSGKHVERYSLRAASIWYEDWFNEPHKNVSVLEELIGRPLGVDLQSVLDRDLQHCRGETRSIRVEDLKAKDGFVPLREAQSDRQKENILAIERRYPALSEKMKRHLKNNHVEIMAQEDGTYRCRRGDEAGGSHEEWTIARACGTDGPICACYKGYSPQRQWLLHAGVTSLCIPCLRRCQVNGICPVLIVEPDVEVFLSYATIHPMMSLLQGERVRLYVGEEAFTQLLEDLNSDLEPYFVVGTSIKPIVSSLASKKDSSLFEPFRTRLPQVFREKSELVQHMRRTFVEKHVRKTSDSRKAILIVAPDETRCLMPAQSLAEGFRALSYSAVEWAVPVSALTPYDTLQLLLEVYRLCPDYLITINHPSDVLVRGIQGVPIKRFVWYVDEPEQRVQPPHGPHDYMFYRSEEFKERLSNRGGHISGILTAGSHPFHVQERDVFRCDVGYVGTMYDTAAFRAALPADLLHAVDRIVDAKIEEPRSRFQSLLDQVGLSANDLAHIVHDIAPGLRQQGMTDPQLLDLFLYRECVRKRQLCLLSALREFDVKVFENSTCRTVLEDTVIRGAFEGGFLTPTECRELYRSATISLNIHPPYPHSEPDPMDMDVPMCDGFLLSDLGRYAGERVREFFEPGIEIALYEGERDLPERVRYYLEHEEERKSTTEAAKARILREHTSRHRAQQMLDMSVRF